MVEALVRDEFTKDRSGKGFEREQHYHFIQPVHHKLWHWEYFPVVPSQVKKK